MNRLVELNLNTKFSVIMVDLVKISAETCSFHSKLCSCSVCKSKFLCDFCLSRSILKDPTKLLDILPQPSC
uniref:Uncharacterized protein n=1 Tax=Lepeophtheirus salmonis TaxID=72036 RepID=A0A0K2VGR2_LEPSM